MATTATERKLLVAGEWIETGEWIDVTSPVLGRASSAASRRRAPPRRRRAIDAAEAAMREPLPAHRRAEILVKVAGALGRRHEEIAQTICAEAGKPLKTARVEASRAMSTYTMAAVEARKLTGEMVPMDASQAGEGKLAFTLRVPIGVVGAISPFNFPLNLVAHKIAPALAAGCAVVLKPATADAALRPPPRRARDRRGPAAGLAERRRRHLVGDRRRARRGRARHSRSRSPAPAPVGWKLKERAPRKRVSLELGNATPVIVEADADLDDAAAKLAGERVLVRRPELHLGPADLRRSGPPTTAFLERFLPKVEALVVGDPADEETDVGPRDRRATRATRDPRVDRGGSRRGAEILAGGDTTEDGLIRPTVIGARDARGEGLLRRDLRARLHGQRRTTRSTRRSRSPTARATGSRPGSSPRTCRAALRAAQALEFGGVTVNEAPTFRADQMPYGGVKDSGNTREGPA